MNEIEKILPRNKRLTKLQINELEGRRPKYAAPLLTANKDELLIKYHLALEAAELEIHKLKIELDLYYNLP